MHPAHVPLVREIKTVLRNIAGNLGPSRRFLRNGNNAMISALDQGI